MTDTSLTDEAPPSWTDTRTHFLNRATRGFVPMAHTFVQSSGAVHSEPGPLRDFVASRDKPGLVAYLYVVAVTSADNADGWSTTLPLRVWAKGFGLPLTSNTVRAQAAAATRIIGRLEGRGLVRRHYDGKQNVRLELLNQDGSGTPYIRPPRSFLKLRHEFWIDGWADDLKLPAIAMLLASLKEKPTFAIPAERVPSWYGWSADTAERGFSELINKGLLTCQKIWRVNHNLATGGSFVNYYSLTDTLRPSPSQRRKAVSTESAASSKKKPKRKKK